MITLKQSNWYVPGTWKGLMKSDGHRSASVTCPLCKKNYALTNHDIAADGTVTPSVVCPTEGCTFHEMVKLEGFQAT